MINEVYRLIAPKQIRVDFIEEMVINEVVVKPTFLSICAADQRYYTGSRGKEIMSKKLPMALIHEAVGEVLYDPKGEFKIGTQVVMIPNTPIEKDEIIKENYLRSSMFRASGFDGFMQDVVLMQRTRIIPFENIPQRTAVLLELASVVMNAMEHFEKDSNRKRETIGVWGNGNLGFVSALFLKTMHPNAKIIVFGVHEQKMQYFPFVDETYLINEIPESLRVDHAFECVGGGGSEKAINQIIDFINPEGSIVLMGVSEQNPMINTRMVLEKGLTLLGNSRSGYVDFKAAVDLLEKNEIVREYLDTIISEEIVIKSVEDMHRAFEHDQLNDFKTVMKWDI
ncbi:MAG: zinc-binding dehydrogenase [Bacilli bacterium]